MASVKKCRSCDQWFNYTSNETYWDYKGMTDTKLVNCKECGKPQVLGYKLLSNPNMDLRYYTYSKENFYEEKEN